MPSAGFEPAISATKRLQTFALDRTVAGTGSVRDQPSNVRGGDVFVTTANLQGSHRYLRVVQGEVSVRWPDRML